MNLRLSISIPGDLHRLKLLRRFREPPVSLSYGELARIWTCTSRP